MDKLHEKFETTGDGSPRLPVRLKQIVRNGSSAPNDQRDRNQNRPVLATVDWELLFGQPNLGYVALIDSAESLRRLKSVTTLVLRTLYRRESDGAAFARLTKRVSQLIPDELNDDELNYAKRTVVKNLRIVKKHRIRPKRPQWYLN